MCFLLNLFIIHGKFMWVKLVRKQLNFLMCAKRVVWLKPWHLTGTFGTRDFLGSVAFTLKEEQSFWSIFSVLPLSYLLCPFCARPGPLPVGFHVLGVVTDFSSREQSLFLPGSLPHPCLLTGWEVSVFLEIGDFLCWFLRRHVFSIMPGCPVF